MDFVLNELSVNTLQTPSQVDDFYSQLERTIHILKLSHFPKIICDPNLLASKLESGTKLFELFQSSGLDREKVTTLYSSIQNAPFIEGAQDLDFEIFHQNNKAVGFEHSHQTKIPTISFPATEWNSFLISADKTSICPKTEELLKSIISIEHLGNLDDYADSWFSLFVKEDVNYKTPEEFLLFASEAFPRVIFSDSSKEALRNLDTSKLTKLERSISILNTYCLNHWRFGCLRKSAVQDLGLFLRDESDTTMQKYSQERRFQNEMNEAEIFSLHFDVSDGERAYLKPLNETRSVFISYIGPHLRTKKFA